MSFHLVMRASFLIAAGTVVGWMILTLIVAGVDYATGTGFFAARDGGAGSLPAAHAGSVGLARCPHDKAKEEQQKRSRR
jgi:hypothetical protein